MKKIFLVLFCSVWPIISLATPTIDHYTLNRKSETVIFNAADGEANPLHIEIVASEPVTFSTIAICLTSDSVCSRTTAMKYFTQTGSSTSVAKDWNGKTGGSNPTLVSDSDYRLRVTMKDQAGVDLSP